MHFFSRSDICAPNFTITHSITIFSADPWMFCFQDVQHLDIDVLRERLDFTYDAINFAGLPEYMAELGSKGIKNVVILDPFLISNETNYDPYDRGLEQDLFIYWPEGTSPDYDIYGNDIMLGYVRT